MAAQQCETQTQQRHWGLASTANEAAGTLVKNTRNRVSQHDTALERH